jgi:putative transposase
MLLRRRRCAGMCSDTAAAETFFATLTNAMHYRQAFATRARVRCAAAKYIEVLYNRKRMHPSIGDRTQRKS